MVESKVLTRILFLMVVSVTLTLTACKPDRPPPRPESKVLVEPKVTAEDEAQSSPRQSSQPPTAGSNPSSAQNPTNGAPPAHYLPPSADGADVEITETPLDGSKPRSIPTPSTPPTTGPTGEAGNMPTQVPPASPQATSSGGIKPATVGTSNPPRPRATESGLSTRAATARARTSAEESGELNQELQRKLAEFDALMKKAQANAARDRAAMAGGGSPDSAANTGRGGLLEAPPGGTGVGGAASAATGLGNTPDKSGTASPGDNAFRSSGAAPMDTPDGSDDDIVARQLREAANRETDLVLQEKLWEEYRKYKGGL